MLYEVIVVCPFCLIEVLSATHFHQKAVQVAYTNIWYRSSVAECPLRMMAIQTGAMKNIANIVTITPSTLAGRYIQP
jgi:hypothetical protein